MTPYRDTIRRHRRKLSLPILISVFLALWMVAGSPKKYESSVSLWVDHPAPAASSLTETDPSLRPPAEQEQLILQELLRTQDFRSAVGDSSPLRAYLATNPSNGWGPFALLGSLSGGKPLNVRMAGALGTKNVTSEVAGPQVLQITYRGATPQVAAGTVQALVTQLGAQVTRLGAERDKASLAFYQSQVNAASRAVAEARTRVAAFRPLIGRASDPHFQALVRAQKSAGRDLGAATAKLNQAASDGPASRNADSAFHVLDAARIPAGPVSGKKKLVMAVVGGAFAGALISLLGLIALTPSKPSPWDAATVMGPLVGASTITPLHPRPGMDMPATASADSGGDGGRARAEGA